MSDNPSLEINEWEHLQFTIRRVHNNAVRDFYRNQPDNDISTSKSAAKHACLMKDNDTADMTIIRFWLFWVLCRKMRDNFEPYRDSYEKETEVSVKYRPKITCYFMEDIQDVAADYRPVEGIISVRVMNETSSTITESNLDSLARKINTAFGANDGYIWNKGKDLYTYADLAEGQRFQVLARTQNDAVDMIRKALSIVGVTYNQDLLRKNEAVDETSAFPNSPGNQTILGKTYKKPRKRPLANVRFLYASIKLHGLKKPIVLVDKTGHWSEAIIDFRS